mmetsp:Transcript_18310/g.44058  ORF Transcript_18310/g.44058 Transcript_18310/m.44058 type:complete len:110 (+) Transcript_18310:42-371(+)
MAWHPVWVAPEDLVRHLHSGRSPGFRSLSDRGVATKLAPLKPVPCQLALASFDARESLHCGKPAVLRLHFFCCAACGKAYFLGPVGHAGLQVYDCPGPRLPPFFPVQRA